MFELEGRKKENIRQASFKLKAVCRVVNELTHSLKRKQGFSMCGSLVSFLHRKNIYFLKFPSLIPQFLFVYRMAWLPSIYLFFELILFFYVIDLCAIKFCLMRGEISCWLLFNFNCINRIFSRTYQSTLAYLFDTML